jgi:acetyl-CoA acetyltransferase
MTRSAVIVGAAQLPLVDGRIVDPPSVLGIQAQAARAAVADAGFIMAEVDGLMVSGDWNLPGPGVLPTVAVGEYLGLRPRYMNATNIGGSTFELFMAHAAMAIERGYCDTVLVTYGSLQRSRRSRTLVGRPPGLMMQHETPYGLPSTVGSYAMAAMRHMHEFGTTSEQLASVAVQTRAWAALNEEATHRGPLSVDDVLASPLVADPLHKYDCCLITDGAAALVLTTEENARAHGARAVRIAGYAEAQSHWTISQMPDIVTTPATRTGPRALAMADLTTDDVDVLEVYDSFTITALLQLEDLGFCKKGEGGRFVTEVGTGPGGGLPMNTSGGGLSFAHPGMYGLLILVEAVRQLRGECGARQVPGARVALVSGMGAVLSSAATCVLVAA